MSASQAKGTPRGNRGSSSSAFPPFTIYGTPVIFLF